MQENVITAASEPFEGLATLRISIVDPLLNMSLSGMSLVGEDELL